MKIIKILLLMLFVIMFVQVHCCSTKLKRYEEKKVNPSLMKNPGNLVFQVHCNQEKYQSGEEIYVTFSLENADTRAFFVNKRFALNAWNTLTDAREVYLDVRSPNNEGLLFGCFKEVDYLTRESFVFLWPGEKIYSVKNLLNGCYDINMVGKYIIEGVYENHSGPEFGYKHVWIGKIQSESVEFEVVEK